MRFRLRTLLVVLAVGPPVFVWAGWIAREFYLTQIAAPELFFREMQWIPPFLLYPPDDSVPDETVEVTVHEDGSVTKKYYSSRTPKPN